MYIYIHTRTRTIVEQCTVYTLSLSVAGKYIMKISSLCSTTSLPCCLGLMTTYLLANSKAKINLKIIKWDEPVATGEMEKYFRVNAR